MRVRLTGSMHCVPPFLPCSVRRAVGAGLADRQRAAPRSHHHEPGRCEQFSLIKQSSCCVCAALVATTSSLRGAFQWQALDCRAFTLPPQPVHHSQPMLRLMFASAGEVQLQLDEAVRAVTQAGIHVVVAAGNFNIK